MNILLNSLSSVENNSILWEYSDRIDLYNKYTQYVNKPVENVIKPVENVIKPVENVIKPVENVIKPVENVIKPVENVIKPLEKIIETSKKSLKDTKKNNKQTPYDIIIKLSDNNIINIEYIKDNLNKFISNKDFQKVFGIKKTSEIMAGITNNKWNKSLVLFLSFLFNTNFVYLNKDVTYGEYNSKIIL